MPIFQRIPCESCGTVCEEILHTLQEIDDEKAAGIVADAAYWRNVEAQLTHPMIHMCKNDAYGCTRMFCENCLADHIAICERGTR